MYPTSPCMISCLPYLSNLDTFHLFTSLQSYQHSQTMGPKGTSSFPIQDYHKYSFYSIFGGFSSSFFTPSQIHTHFILILCILQISTYIYYVLMEYCFYGVLLSPVPSQNYTLSKCLVLFFPITNAVIGYINKLHCLAHGHLYVLHERMITC